MQKKDFKRARSREVIAVLLRKSPSAHMMHSNRAMFGDKPTTEEMVRAARKSAERIEEGGDKGLFEAGDIGWSVAKQDRRQATPRSSAKDKQRVSKSTAEERDISAMESVSRSRAKVPGEVSK